MNATQTDTFEEGEQTQTRPYHNYHADLEEPEEDFEREVIDKTEETPDRSEVSAREERLFKGTSKQESMSNSRRKEQSYLLVKHGTNAIISSTNPREEQPTSKAKSLLYDEGMTSRQTDGLTSGYVHPGLVQSDVDFTPSPT